MNTSEWFFQTTFLHCFNSHLFVSLLCLFWLRSLNYGFIPLSCVRVMKKRFYELRRFDHVRFHPFLFEESSAAAWSWQTPRLCQMILMIQFVFKVYQSRNQPLSCRCIFTRFGLRSWAFVDHLVEENLQQIRAESTFICSLNHIIHSIHRTGHQVVEFLSVLAHDSWLSEGR
jgi:hypothetical protein